jgi:hypothetical protein
MLRPLRILSAGGPQRPSPPCCTPGLRRARLVLLLLIGAGAALLPLAARSAEPGEPLVAEALFLCDPLPPGGRDLGLGLATGPDGTLHQPRLQLALALGDRVGLTADAVLAPATGLAAPGAALKLLLRAPTGGALGVAASLELLGGSTAAETETAVGVGLIRPLGRVTLRAGGSLATPLGAWSPHLHGGASAALALAPRWRLLAETIVELGDGAMRTSAGPAIRVAFDDRTSLAVGALFTIDARNPAPSFALQVTRGL